MPEDDGKDFGPWQAIDPSRRYFRRWTVDLPAVVHDRGTARHCVVHDLCPGGAQLIIGEGEPLAVGAEVVLSLEPYGSISTEVRYAEGDRVGYPSATGLLPLAPPTPSEPSSAFQ